MALTYPGGPNISLTATGISQAIVGGATLQTVGLVGAAPQGSDHCTVMSIRDAWNFYGSPTAAASASSTIPRALYLMAAVSQLPGALPFNVAIMAAGKTSATTTFGTGFVATATGAYAGTRGNRLSMTFTCSGGVITNISVTDTTLSQVVQSFNAAPVGPYNLLGPSGVTAAINGSNEISNPNSVFRITTVGSVLPTTTTTVSFSGSTNDGTAVTATDSSIDTLLAESLLYDITYLVPLFDVAAVQPKIATHLSACASELLYRLCVMAPWGGATWTAITSGTPYIPAFSDRYNAGDSRHC